MTFCRSLLNELKRCVFSVEFLVTVLIVALSYFFSSLEEIKFMRNSSSVDVLYFFDLVHNIGSFTTLSVLCCTVLNCTSFLRDYKSKYYYHRIMRSGNLTYVLSKYISCVIGGGLILALGEFLFVLSLAFEFPLVSESSSTLESYSHAADIYFISEPLSKGNYVGVFAIYGFLAFIFGALWSGVGITVSAFITDNYVASFSPYIIWFISCGILPDDLRTEVYLRGNYNFDGAAKSLAVAFIYFTTITVLLGIIFCKKAGKRCEE